MLAGTSGIHKQIQGEGPYNFRFAFFHRNRELDFHSQGPTNGRPQNINENFYINLFDRGAYVAPIWRGPLLCFIY